MPIDNDFTPALAEASAKARLNAAAADMLEVLQHMLKAVDDGTLQMNSPELGEPEVGIPLHPWHEEMLYYARTAVAKATST